MSSQIPSFIPSQYQGEYVYLKDGHAGAGYYFQRTFYPSHYFQAHYPGYVFTTREFGTGYYIDKGNPTTSPHLRH